MEKEDKLKCVLIDFEQGEITLSEASNTILRLFSVVGQNEQLPICKCENTERQDYGDGWNITCLDCGKNW